MFPASVGNQFLRDGEQIEFGLLPFEAVVAVGTVVAPSGIRGLTSSGACAPSVPTLAGCENAARLGAGVSVPTALPSGVRLSASAGASVEITGPIVSPAGIRSLASSGACSVGSVTAILTGCRSGAVRGAPIVLSVSAVSGSRLLAVAGAFQLSTLYLVSPAGIRGLSSSGASVELPTTSFVSVSGIRSLAKFGASRSPNDIQFVPMPLAGTRASMRVAKFRRGT